MAGRGPKSELERLREQLREKYRKPWAETMMQQPMPLQPPTILALTSADEWCIVVNTYPDTADTLCGRKGARATVFATAGHPDFPFQRVCEGCARRERAGQPKEGAR